MVDSDPRVRAQERRAFKECDSEAFWLSSLPLAVIVGVGVRQLVRLGKLKRHRKFGALPHVIWSSALAYYAGKLLYISSDSCLDKFLKVAPDSEISYRIRQNRGIAQPWTAVKKFEGKPSPPGVSESRAPIDATEYVLPATPNFESFRPEDDEDSKLSAAKARPSA